MIEAGLILEGGGMRGIYTAGVLDFFMDQNIEFSSVYGVSAGACHACSYLSKQRGRAYRVGVNYLKDKRYCSVYSLLTTGDMFGVEMCYDLIPNQLDPYDDEAFQRYQGKFFAVVTNCRTGKAEYMRVQGMNKDMIAVRASSSLPLLSRNVVIGEEKYLDGGIADSIPLMESVRCGNRKNVLVLTQHDGYRKSSNKLMLSIKLRYRKYPKLVTAMATRHIRYNHTLEWIEREEKKGNIFVLRPHIMLGIRRIEKDATKLRPLYELGYEDAKNQYDALSRYLEK